MNFVKFVVKNDLLKSEICLQSKNDLLTACHRLSYTLAHKYTPKQTHTVGRVAAIKSIDSVEIKMNEKIAIDRQQENMELNG